MPSRQARCTRDVRWGFGCRAFGAGVCGGKDRESVVCPGCASPWPCSDLAASRPRPMRGTGGPTQGLRRRRVAISTRTAASASLGLRPSRAGCRRFMRREGRGDRVWPSPIRHPCRTSARPSRCDRCPLLKQDRREARLTRISERHSLSFLSAVVVRLKAGVAFGRFWVLVVLMRRGRARRDGLMSTRRDRWQAVVRTCGVVLPVPAPGPRRSIRR